MPSVLPKALGALAVLSALVAGSAVAARPLLLKAPSSVDASVRVTGPASYVDTETGRQVPGTFVLTTSVKGHAGSRSARVASYDTTSRSTFTPTGGAARQLTSTTSTYAFDRSTGEGRPGEQGDTLGTRGHLYKLPFGTPHADATAWDDTARREVPLVFRRTTVVRGLPVLEFSRDVPPTDLGVLPLFEAVPGRWVGQPGVASVPAHEWYESRGSRLWVEPVTGVVVGGESSPHLWAQTADGRRVDLLVVDRAAPDDASAARLVRDAAHARQQVLRLQRAPWVLGGLAVLLLVAAVGTARRRVPDVSGDVRAAEPLLR